MQIQSVNNQINNTNFGAHIRLRGERISTLLNYADKARAWEVMDRFEKFHPDDVVEIDWFVKPKENGEFSNWLSAKNLTTGDTKITPIFPENYEKYNVMKNCYDFYGFLGNLLNPEVYGFEKFWGKAPVKNFDNVDLKNHSVFIP